jgi:alpha-L-fucosidase
MKRILFFFLFTFCLTVHSYAQKNPAVKPYGALPSADQIRWQQMEYYMFIHFGPNTFTDKEWGDGRESPMVFNPTNLDARQWARTAKEAGMKAIIITAKHHDGFCLWPSEYSTHTVRESPWKGGKGDILKELSEACREYGLKFGVYLSPWDQNHPDYGTEKYNQIFASTLQEVLSNYGEVFEVWFDGANGEGPNGKTQEYDWDLFHKTVFEHQPQAIIFSDIGPGTRWIGNEKGFAGETNWSTLNIEGFGVGKAAPRQSVLNTGDENGSQWIPGEADVSIRPGWFFSPNTNDKVKTLAQLMQIYHWSVGRNANLLLNVPVSREGLIHQNDSTRLMELRQMLDESFKTNLASGKEVVASVNQAFAKNLTDGDFGSYWAAPEHDRTASLVLKFGSETNINRLLLQEYIPMGQRVRAFTVEYWKDGSFVELDRQTTIGYKRILTFPAIKTSQVRIRMEATPPRSFRKCRLILPRKSGNNPEQPANWLTRPKNGKLPASQRP